MTTPLLEPETAPSVVVKVTGVTGTQRARWLAAAGHESLSSWSRRQLDRAAGISLGDLDAGRALRLLAEMGFRPLGGDPNTMIRDEEHHFTPEQVQALMDDWEMSAGRVRLATHLAEQEIAAVLEEGGIEEGGDGPVGTGQPPVDGSALDRSHVPPSSSAVKPVVTTKKSRSKMCAHRVPAGTYCKRCKSA